VLASTIKTKEEKFILKPVTLGPLLLLFKEIKGLNAKMLCSLFIFKRKVPEVKEEDSKSNRFTSLEDVFAANFLQKYKARKAFKKSLKKKLKIEPAEPLAFSRANR
jgi:hypothetical protein